MGSGTYSNSKPAPAAGGNNKFITLDTLVMANGIKGIISQRLSNGVITFSIVREFERDGVPDWTSYFSEVQMADFKKMMEMVEDRITQLRRDPKVRPMQASNGGR
jgi:hypothetical protein